MKKVSRLNNQLRKRGIKKRDSLKKDNVVNNILTGAIFIMVFIAFFYSFYILSSKNIYLSPGEEINSNSISNSLKVYIIHAKIVTNEENFKLNYLRILMASKDINFELLPRSEFNDLVLGDSVLVLVKGEDILVVEGAGENVNIFSDIVKELLIQDSSSVFNTCPETVSFNEFRREGFDLINTWKNYC